jgi:P27 family predicted phage terminase small subunit
LLGEEGRKAWFYLWEQHWLNPRRHCRIATRYCQLQDLLAAAFAQVKRDGLMVKGSQGQLRIHPGMVEIRLLSTECRLIETELGLTPGSESRAGADRQLPPGPLDAMLARQREGA